MYTLPLESSRTPKGLSSWAEVAGPPSPLPPPAFAVPVPAIVVMSPLPAVTSRTAAFLESAMKMLPAGSTKRPVGSYSCALVAGCPSPASPWVPLPAIVVTLPLVVVNELLTESTTSSTGSLR